MSDEQELERLVVRLLGDAESYQKMLNEAKKASEEAKQRIESAANSMSARAVAAGTIVAHALEEMAHEVKQFASEAVEAFSQKEDTLISLGSAIRNNGEAVQATMKDFEEFAMELQTVTTSGEHATLGLLQVASSMGLNAEQAKRAAKEAIALSATMGGTADGYIRMTSRLGMGTVGRIGMLVPIPKDLKDEAAQLAYIHERLASNFGTAESKASSFKGQLQQLGNLYEELQESIGKIVADALRPFVGMLRDITNWLNSLDDSTKRWVVGVGTAVVAAAGLVAALKGMQLILPELIVLFKGLAATIGLAFAHPALAAAGVAIGGIGIIALGATGQLTKMFAAMEPPPVKGNLPKASLEGLSKEQAARARLYERAIADYDKAAGNGTVGLSKQAFTQAVTGLKELNDLSKALTEAKERKEALNLATGTLSDKLWEELSTLGMSSAQAEIYKLSLKGLDDATQVYLYDLASWIDEEKQATKLKEELSKKAQDLVTDLQMEADTYGMTARMARIYKAEVDGINLTDAAHSRELADKLDKMDAEKQWWDEMAAAAERYRTPQEQLTDEIDKINALFDLGMISGEEWSYGIEQAYERANKAAMSYRTEGMDAVLAGSGEAERRAKDFLASMEEANKRIGPMQGNAAGGAPGAAGAGGGMVARAGGAPVAGNGDDLAKAVQVLIDIRSQFDVLNGKPMLNSELAPAEFS
jgi:hypothetical protein